MTSTHTRTRDTKGKRSIIEYNLVHKTSVYDEIVKGILFQASRFLHTRNEFLRRLVPMNTIGLQGRAHVRRHALEDLKIFDTVLVSFSSSFGQYATSTYVLVRRRTRVNTRLCEDLEHSRHGYGRIPRKVYLYSTQHV